MSRRKLLIISDILLIAVFIATAVSGLHLHISTEKVMERMPHSGGETLLHIHAACALLFLLLCSIHIYFHWGWFKGASKSIKNKSIITTVTTVVFFLTVLTSFAGTGILHAKLGEILILACLVHFAIRVRALTGLFMRKPAGIRNIEKAR